MVRPELLPCLRLWGVWVYILTDLSVVLALWSCKPRLASKGYVLKLSANKVEETPAVTSVGF